MSEAKVENLVNKELGFPRMEEFEAELIRLMNGAEGEGSGPIILALVDSDNFLRVNTDFGRECGDKVLIDTGRYLEAKLPAGATIYRVSGDEFGIIFNNDIYMLGKRCFTFYFKLFLRNRVDCINVVSLNK